MPVHFEKSVFANATDAAAAFARAIAELIAASHQKTFSIALSGGSSPKAAYQLLAQPPLVDMVPWGKLKVFWGDERMVPHDHPDSNYNMAFHALLAKVPVKKKNIFPVPVNLSPIFCALEFEAILEDNLPLTAPDGFPQFDLMLLGIGPDGHTASLFPGTDAPEETVLMAVSCNPLEGNPNIKPAVERVTVTAPVIQCAKNVFVFAAGNEKIPALRGIFDETPPWRPPVSRLLRDCAGKVRFFLDQPEFQGK